MTKRPTDSSVGPWARDKLDSLRRYLEYYTTRLKNQSWCRGTFFIDAFAGPGLSPIRQPNQSARSQTADLFGDQSTDESDVAEIEYIKGSPRVALEIRNPFTDYIFIERDPERLAELAELRREFGGGPRIQIFRGDANEEIERLLARGIDWRTHKGVVFLDPFGMQVPWTTIRALARTKGLEVLLNFPFAMAINRLLKVSGEISPAWQDRLDATFGSPDWRGLVYEETKDLVGVRRVKREDAAERVLKWFSERLRAEFGFASEAQLIKNTRGSPLYYLIWAGPHKAGLTGADYILGQRQPKRRSQD